MRSIGLAIALIIGLIGPAAAQKAEIKAATSKWMTFFNKGAKV